MKTRTTKRNSIAILVVVLLLPLPAITHATSIQDWQGEWGQWSSPDGSANVYGASVSISACSEQTSSCRLRLDAESKKTRCEYRGKGDGLEMKLSGDGTATAQVTDHAARPSACSVNLKLENVAGKRQLHVDVAGVGCDYFCTEGSAIAQVYPFRRAESYPPGWQQACFADNRDSRQTWCLDSKIQALDTRLYDLDSKYDALKHNDALSKKREAVREAALKSCHAVADISGCQLEAFAKAVGDFEQDVAAAQKEHDKTEALLAQKGDARQASQLITQIDGVYKKRFANGNVDGEHYTSEDILEIVRVAEDAVYFRASLAFFNGHSCGQYGVARFSQAGVFVFTDTQQFADNRICRLQFEVSDKAITIRDPDNSCRNYCGARGFFDRETFARKARQTIRYMTILKNSEEYKEALKTLENPPAVATPPSP